MTFYLFHDEKVKVTSQFLYRKALETIPFSHNLLPELGIQH